MKKSLLFIFSILLFSLAITAQTYVGDDKCMGCHGAADVSQTGYNIYEQYMLSGHPYKLSKVESGVQPEYPTKITIPLPTTKTWDDFAYVIGGYGWKARFVQKNGYIYTGDNGDSTAQYNLANDTWVDYHKGEATKGYNYGCFTCHTTGPSEEGSWPEGSEGFGTFAQPGIRCEACHGPASEHTATFGSTKTPIQGDSLKIGRCGDCHQRGGRTNAIPQSGDYIKHHEQFNEMNASKHGSGSMTCATCHDSHIAFHQKENENISPKVGESIIKTCDDAACHGPKPITITKEDGSTLTKSATCVNCHMPKASKSAVGTINGNGLAGDVSTHIFKINTDAVDRTAMYEGGLVKLDDGIASVTMDFACLNCHTNEDVTWAASYADGIHSGIMVDVEDIAGELPTTYALEQNYPNPFNPSTSIKFSIPEDGDVKLYVYSITGELVAELIDHVMPAGTHIIKLDASAFTSGTYIYSLRANDFVQSKKMILLK